MSSGAYLAGLLENGVIKTSSVFQVWSPGFSLALAGGALKH